MASPIPQEPDKAKDAKAAAAVSNSVPELRDAVVTLTEVVQQQAAEIAKLQRRRS